MIFFMEKHFNLKKYLKKNILKINEHQNRGVLILYIYMSKYIPSSKQYESSSQERIKLTNN